MTSNLQLGRWHDITSWNFFHVYLERVPNQRGHNPTRAVYSCVQDAGKLHKSVDMVGI